MTADALVAELSEKVGLDAVDAHRSAFTALACSKGWTKARVGRWLGISRARVGQKFDKLLHYATTRDDTPVLTTTMRLAVRTPARRTEYDDVVAYSVGQWNDLDFARSMMQHVDTVDVSTL